MPTTSGDDRVVASPLAASALRFSDSIGAVEVRGGPTYVLAGEIELPRELDFLDPVLLQPTDSSQSDPLRMLVITVDKPGNVSAVTPMVKSFLGVDDPSKLRIESNEKLAELRGQVSGQIGADNRGLVMLLTGLTGVLLSAILYGLVMLRRKDYGRRRALGASRSLIVGLVVVQTTITSTLGAACGTSASLIAMVIAGDRWPSIEILSAVTVVTITTGTMAAVVPAVAASRRDPITELRVP